MDAPKQKPAGQLAFSWEKTQAEIAISLQFIQMNHMEMIQTELFSELA